MSGSSGPGNSEPIAERHCMSEAQCGDMTTLVNDTFAPLHGLQRAVSKDAGITGTLLAFLTSGVAVAVAKAVTVRMA